LLKAPRIDYYIYVHELHQVTNVLRWLFQICVAMLFVLFSLPFLLLLAFVFVVMFRNGATETSAVTAVAGGMSIPGWFFIVLALPVLFAGLYLITRWARHRR